MDNIIQWFKSFFLSEPIKIALLISITYSTDIYINNVKSYLINKKNFSPENIYILNNINSTKENIIYHFAKLLSKANKSRESFIFIQYIGTSLDINGQIVLSTSFVGNENSDLMISREDLFDNFICKMNSSCSVFVMIDCFSYFVSELKYIYSLDERNIFRINNKGKDINAQCLMINGLPRINENKKNIGLISKAFLNTVGKDSNFNIKMFVLDMKDWLKKNSYSHILMLTSSSYVDVETKMDLIIKT